MKLIEIKNLNYSYKDSNFALKNINLNFSSGEYVSIIGPNGSGKSTLARLIIGLLNSGDGDIFIDGKKFDKKTSADLRKNMTMVFQNPENQFIANTVEEDIAFGLENRRVDQKDMKAIIEDAASKVGMLDFLKKEPSYLSGGQKQRVAIASAIALNPKVLILDEATSMLDPSGKSKILEIIRDLQKNNPELLIISITHDSEEAYKSSRVVLLDKGEIIADGKPEDVLSYSNCVKHEIVPPFEAEIKENFSDNNIHSVEEVVKEICK